jgi:hypothetical protein
MITEFRNGINGIWPSRNEKIKKKKIIENSASTKNGILKTKKIMKKKHKFF